MCFTVIDASFVVATCFARGFDSFLGMIKMAKYIRISVRPRNTIVQVLGSKFDIKRVGHLTEAIIILVIAVRGIDMEWAGGKYCIFYINNIKALTMFGIVNIIIIYSML